MGWGTEREEIRGKISAWRERKETYRGKVGVLGHFMNRRNCPCEPVKWIVEESFIHFGVLLSCPEGS